MNRPIISAESASEAARSYLMALRQHTDSMLTPWCFAKTGVPFLVRTLELEPSFWLVPVVHGSFVLGHVEVGADGKVWGHTYFFQNQNDLSVCPTVVTRICADEALELTSDIRESYGDAVFANPVFVHDGLRNRLAWMIEVRIEGELVSRIFATPKYAYQRKTGEKPPPPGMRGR